MAAAGDPICDLVRWAVEKKPTKEEFNKRKIDVARRYKLGGIPKNSEILSRLGPVDRRRLLPLLQRKPVRTISGVAIVAVMTRPYPCPHGRCSYCPGGPEENTPQSYTGEEPAALRAKQNLYDPYQQVTRRLAQLEAIGHPIGKVELILMGGTFLAQPRSYQEWFVKKCLEAMNNYYSSSPAVNTASNQDNSLEEVQRINEIAHVRNVGITFETRPDHCFEPHVDSMLRLGATRVEIGVQILDDEIYRRVNRGHTVGDVVRATRVARDAGLKICYHIMPGLPGSTPSKDLECFKKLFEDPRFRPDMLKIYPTLVLAGTELYEEWRRANYSPLTTEQAVELITKFKEHMPVWVRTMRIQRDIPSNLVVAGVKRTDLGALVQENLRRRGSRCLCIRCREVGHRKGEAPEPEDLTIYTTVYEASGGKEFFLSVEDPGRRVIVGYARLRYPGGSSRPEITEDTCILRELHVCGPMVPVGDHGRKDSWQHRGIGSKLLEEVESLAVGDGYKRLVVTSGIGVREYYRSHGYELDGVYMVKKLV
ncbi:MAG: tRNA uridine(34) 5-carboxymethylaminomethyl modification radical SAM/GNAT enzyme Elp3 [Methanobacteriota archaeon]|nr:MAG: tRNA uridine(34) 5-carboxymethylaminomethyl modification radical SAM/GNAT enzyme Elp3 [Euryarchaeota archaeon]